MNSYDKRVAIDYNMSVFWTNDHIYNEDDIAHFFDNIKCGVSTVYWRTSMIGSVTYKSKIQKTTINTDWDDYFRNNKEKEERTVQRLALCEKYRYIFDHYDPPEIAIREAKRVGIKIYIWITCFDDYYPGHHGVFAEDGVCLAEAKDGRKMRGVLSYAWEEAKKRRLSEIKELLSYGADGLYICTKSHTQHSEPSREYDTYGYEKPVVDEFKKRYGVDILQTDDFDKNAWHSLKGEFFTLFLREVKKLINEKGQKLSLGAMVGKYHYFRAPTLKETHVLRFENQWEIWAKDNLVDELIIGNGQKLWIKDPLWVHPEIPWDENTEQAGFLAHKLYPKDKRHNMKIYLWSGWVPNVSTEEAKQNINNKLQSMKKACETTDVDGMLIHEADAFEVENEYALIKNA